MAHCQDSALHVGGQIVVHMGKEGAPPSIHACSVASKDTRRKCGKSTLESMDGPRRDNR